MPNILDRALKQYENSDLVVQMKARFFFFLCLIILIILPVAIIYTAYLHLQNPTLGYTIDYAILLPPMATFVLFIAILVLLLRGYFAVSTHLILIMFIMTTWTIIILDRAFIVSRLDTIAYIFAILSLTPLAVVRNGTAILVYGVVNLAMLFVFTIFFGEQFNIPHNSLIDYMADNTIALIFMTITAFSIFAINRNALTRAEKALAEQKLAEKARLESDERFRSLFEYSRDAITIIEPPSWRFNLANQSFIDMFRIDTDKTDYTDLTPWDVSPELQPDSEASIEKAVRMIDMAIANGWNFFEWRHRRFDGQEFPATVLLSKCQINDRFFFQVTLRDITERKRAEEQTRSSLREKEVLLKEIHHRVKNNFQIIISLINLQSGNVKDKDLLKLFQESTNRIRAMALVHEKLYQSEDISQINFASYIKTIAEELYNFAVTPGGPRLRIDAEDVLLGIDQAIPCGLIVNELLTNALKYAFPARGTDTEILVAMRHDNSGNITLTVRDNGVGLPEGLDCDTISTLGFQLVPVLVDQISGTYRIDRQDGTSWTITFPSTNPCKKE